MLVGEIREIQHSFQGIYHRHRTKGGFLLFFVFLAKQTQTFFLMCSRLRIQSDVITDGNISRKKSKCKNCKTYGNVDELM